MEKALIIDDNRVMAESVAQLLSFFDFPSTVALGTRAGLTELKEVTPSIIFLDLNMPGLTGFDVLTFIRREPRLKDVPVVVVTSDDQPQSAERAISSGASAYIVKPISLDVLEETLKSLDLL